MHEKQRIVATLLMNAALPLAKLLVDEKPALAAKYRGWNRTVQFQIKNDPELACHLSFTEGNLEYYKGRHDNPDLDFIFKNAAAFNAMMTGKIALPVIRGALKNLSTLIGFLPLMLGLTLLLPSKIPKDQQGKALKVKMLLYFISVALSQLNRAGDEDMKKFTGAMPDRIFQWSVSPDGPAVYLRVKKGKTKAGKGFYTRRKPFVHMMFAGTEGAFLVLTGQIDNVEAMKLGYLVVDGSPEYGKDISTIMKKIEAMVA
jgi:putative sterol carrier protein